MPASQRDVKNRIASVKNIEKITRAMQMIAAARLRRAEQRIEHLRPYADAIRRMTRPAAEAAENVPSLPIPNEYVSGRRGASSLSFRGLEVAGTYVGFTERPNFPDAREIAQDLMAAFIDGEV